MANWAYNYLTMTGDVDIIVTIVKSHFQTDPRTNPGYLPDICVFRGLLDDPDNHDTFDFGFQLQMGSTKEESSTLDPTIRWDGVITSPFSIFWVSKWGASGDVPNRLLSLYPSVELEYSWIDYDSGHRDGIGQKLKSENGHLIVISDTNIDYCVSASKLIWENGRVFVPPSVECTWSRNHDRTPCRPEQFSGFWIHQDDLKYTHPDEIGEHVEAHLTRNGSPDDSRWDVSLYTPCQYRTASESLPQSDPESEAPEDILSFLRERTAKIEYEAELANTLANGDAMV
jgi:hypothetical protein